MIDRKLMMVALAALTFAASSGCGGGSGEGRPSLTATPSVSLPSATRSVTASPGRSETNPPSDDSTSEEPTSEEPTSEEPTSEEPTSEEPTTEEPTTEEPTSEEPTTAKSTTPAAEQTASEEDTFTSWPLFLLLAAIVAAVVGVVVAARRRSARRDWTASLAAARTESEGLARDLAPSLLADTRESRRGGWAVARPQVVALQDRLAALARSAPEVADSTVASDLGAAVGDLRRSLDQEVQAPEEQGAVALRAARAAAQRLEELLAATVSPSPGPT